MRSFRQLEVDSGGIEGARAKFQKLAAQVVKLKHKDAVEVLAAPGDWGIDVLVGTLTSGTCLVWQAKYFMDGVKMIQRKEIDDSFAQLVKCSAEKEFKVDAWELCVPCCLSPPAITWWEKWKKIHADSTNIAISLMCQTDLEQILMSPEGLHIQKEFNLYERQQSLAERVILDLPANKSSEYEKALFIKKLVVAGITENMSARCQFFNAELVKQEITQKGDQEEIKALTNLYEKIHSMWETRFIEALQDSDPVAATKAIYSEMLRSIEQSDNGILASPGSSLSFFHKQGLMQQLANICKIGWSPDFHELDTPG